MEVVRNAQVLVLECDKCGSDVRPTGLGTHAENPLDPKHFYLCTNSKCGNQILNSKKFPLIAQIEPKKIPESPVVEPENEPKSA